MSANSGDIVKKAAPYGYLVASLYFFLFAPNSVSTLARSEYYALLRDRNDYYSHVMTIVQTGFYALMFFGLLKRMKLFFWINALLMLVIFLTFPFGSLLFPGWLVFASGFVVVFYRNWYLKKDQQPQY